MNYCWNCNHGTNKTCGTLSNDVFCEKVFLENPAVDELPYIVFDNTKPVKNMREIGFECKTGKSDESLSI